MKLRTVFLGIAVALPAPQLLFAQETAAPRFAAWNIGYRVPAGWQLAQQQGRVHGLTPSTPGSGIYVAPGMYANFNDVANELPKAFQALGLVGQPAAPPTSATIKGMQSMTATFHAQGQGGILAEVRVTAILTPHGTGLVIMGLAPMQAGAQMSQATEQIAQSIEVLGAPQPDQRAIAALRGRWIYYAGKAKPVTVIEGGGSRSHEENVEFDGAGQFTWSSATTLSLTTPGSETSANSGGSNADQGTYTVIGSTLIVRGRQGTASFEIQILADRIVADGRVFYRNN